MANFSPNINLELPTSPEHYDIGVFNKNNMVIDSEINKINLKNQSQDEKLDEEITRALSSEGAIDLALKAHISDQRNPHFTSKEQLELGNVDNTSDLEKPVSIFQQNALNLAICTHNESESSHDDIRSLVSGLSIRLNALADSDDTTLDQLSEIVTYIKSNRSLIDSITTSKVSISDIIDNLTSTATNKALSAKQGKIVKDLIDTLTITVNNKVDKVSGKGLSSNDYTTIEKNKLLGIENSANKYIHPTSTGNKHIPSGGSSGQILKWSSDGTAVWGTEKENVQSDWNVTDVNSGAFIKNKPTMPTLESIGAASTNHTHGSMETITYSTTEPTTVADGEIVMVYEDGGN